MVKEDTKYDVAVIGGGPAGIMAAIQASSPEQSQRACPERSRRVVLIEKNKQLGKKLLLTGGGRCNLTNAEFNLKKLVENYHNGEFLFHAFSVFGPKESIKFFENLGVKTKIETNNRVFPKSDKASEILEALKKELAKNPSASDIRLSSVEALRAGKKVEILYNSEVVDVEKKGDKITKIILKDGEVTAAKYILATGGKSYPQTGSNGVGYKLAEKLGHTIVKLSPALCPIRLKPDKSPQGNFDGPVTIPPKADLVGNLQGISLKNIRINVLQNKKKMLSEDGEILFTHFGISGPAVLNISGKVGELLEKGGVKICIDLFPELNHEEVLKSFEEILKKYPRQIIKNILAEIAPEKFVEILLNVIKIDKSKIANNMSKIEKAAIVKILKNFELTVEDVFGFDGARVTRGGISLKEIDHRTMKSKVIDNLFFAGEIIDVDGKTGGFDLQMCWSTGFIAGQDKQP